ncbi:MAG: lamin tail domain-containing protein [Chloroflexi bacterium]|nr:lamin tail domain-containing protein [Chloroflexota bacterium]
MREPRHLLFFAVALVAFAAAGLARGTPTASAFDYVENGGFELGTDRWTLISPGSTFDTEADAVGPSEGAVRGRITLAEGRFTLTQTSLAGAPAGRYDFSVRLRATSDALLVSAQVLSSSPVAVYWKQEASYLSGAWTELSGTVDVTGYDSIIIRIGGNGSPGDVLYVDDVRFEGAPPATMTPTNTPIPPTETPTPVPPTPTKTPKATATVVEATPAGPPPTPAEHRAIELASGSVSNGGFEDVAEGGRPVAWDKYGGELSTSSSIVRTGAHSALLESSSESTKWLYQPVLVASGTSYTFDAWVLLDDPGVSSSWLRISWYASPDGSGEALDTSDSTERLDGTSGEWRSLTTGSVTAPAGAASAKLRVMLQPASGGTAALYVDDASFGISDPPLAELAASTREDTAPGHSVSQQVLGESSRRGSEHRSAGNTAGTDPKATLVINEVLYDSSMEGPDADGEWVELYNPGPASVSLEGWALADKHSVDRLPAVTILPGAFAIVAGSPEFRERNPGSVGTLVSVEGVIGNSLGNDGDVLVLVDATGYFVDAVSWGDSTAALDPSIPDVPAGHSIERRIPGGDSGRASDFIDNEWPSPGRAYGQLNESSRPSTAAGSPVQILRGDTGFSLGWLPWALAAVSMGALAGIASWRLLPPLASRLRHQ